MAPIKRSEHPLTAALRGLLSLSPPPSCSVCVALSGGMDSSALLSAALPLRGEWELSACHVNHGISRRAAQWEEFCREQCARADVPLVVHRETPTPVAASEEWARAARLRAFAALSADAVLLAHHADDQAETVLFRLLRGAGAHGLAAMRPATLLAGKRILRPWLDIRRSVVAEYAVANRLRWIEDEDNRNERRRRNFLRWRILPLLADGAPDGIAPLAAAANRLRDAAELLRELAEADERAAQLADGGFSASYFCRLGESRLRNWLYAALLARGCRVSERHVAEAARQVVAADERRGELRFDFQELTLHKWRDGLYWDARQTASPAGLADFCLEVPAKAATLPLAALGGELVLSEEVGGGLSPARLGGGLSAKLRRGGERLLPPGRPTRAVADLLREAEIAPWRRRRLPLLFARGRLAAVPGVAVSAEFAAREKEVGLRCSFRWYG